DTVRSLGARVRGPAPAVDGRGVAGGGSAAAERRAHRARGDRLPEARPVAHARAAPRGALRDPARALLLHPSHPDSLLPERDLLRAAPVAAPPAPSGPVAGDQRRRAVEEPLRAPAPRAPARSTEVASHAPHPLLQDLRRERGPAGAPPIERVRGSRAGGV